MYKEKENKKFSGKGTQTMLNKIFNFYTEKGNVSVKTRAALKDKVITKLNAVIPGIEDSEKGLRIPLVTNERNETVYAFITVTVSANTEVKEKATKAKANDPVVIPDIFGE